jgi:hypothetical protein
MRNIVEKWERLPEAARWILCWPLIFILPFLAEILFKIGQWMASMYVGPYWSTTDRGTPNNVTTLVDMMTGGLVFNFSLYAAILVLAPRGQDIIAAFFAFFLSGLAALSLFLDFNVGILTKLQLAGAVIYVGAFIVGTILCAAQVRHNVKTGSRDLAWFGINLSPHSGSR